MKSIWETFFYKPLLNLLAFLLSILPNADLGLAIVILTLLVKIITYPLSKLTINNQKKMNLLMPEFKRIKKDAKNTKEEQARKIFELYKKHKVNPFSGILLLLIQIPIIFALFFVFYKGLEFKPDLLYSFIKAPENINMLFFGLINLSAPSLFLAIIVGISQYLQAITAPQPIQEKADKGEPESFQESFSKSMQMQMKYFFPPLVAFFSYQMPSAVALYWAVNNLLTIAQQLYINHEDIKITKER